MILPIIIASVVLGRGFHISTMESADSYIFDQDDVAKNIVKIPRTISQTQYRVMETSSEANDFLDVDGTFTLKIKDGKFGLQGSGHYLMKDINRENTVEVLIQVYHETVTETFPSYTKFYSDFYNKAPEALGSHYIRSVTYGGQLIVQYLFKTNSTEHMQHVKAAVSANLAISGTFDGEVKGKLDKLSKEIKDIAEGEIHVSATTGNPAAPDTLDGVFKMVKEYPKNVQKLNKGKGSPMKFEIVGLETLKAEPESFVKNLALDALLNEAINKFDDVRAAHEAFKHWKAELQSSEFREKYDTFYDELIHARNEFSSAITKLRADGDLHQFDKAFKAYGEGAKNIPNRFSRELIALKNLYYKKDVLWYPYSSAITNFIHWGSVNCTLPSPEPVYVGFAATSPRGYGNGGSIECLSSSKPEVDDKHHNASSTESQINGINYVMPNGATGPVLCALCRLENATSTFVIPARTECPEETKMEYSGLMMVGKGVGSTSRFVCMNKVPDHHIPGGLTVGFDRLAGILEPVWTLCKDDDCEEGDDKKYVNCVVCSR